MSSLELVHHVFVTSLSFSSELGTRRSMLRFVFSDDEEEQQRSFSMQARFPRMMVGGFWMIGWMQTCLKLEAFKKGWMSQRKQTDSLLYLSMHKAILNLVFPLQENEDGALGYATIEPSIERDRHVCLWKDPNVHLRTFTQRNASPSIRENISLCHRVLECIVDQVEEWLLTESLSSASPSVDSSDSSDSSSSNDLIPSASTRTRSCRTSSDRS